MFIDRSGVEPDDGGEDRGGVVLQYQDSHSIGEGVLFDIELDIPGLGMSQCGQKQENRRDNSMAALKHVVSPCLW